ncbi:hypothetical protein [Geminicoccus roseus]|uniref:hypothetical protein n=1 Tax=Geminicoccus roseus TaxID=404900 RepID=UPI000410F6C5|nr:hypothetical protein [Geminicoccus roseus]
MADPASFSDQALSVFAFAVYHQLESGEPVSAVARRDQAGHQASQEGVAELQERGMATVEGDRILFTQAGQEVVQRLAQALRAAA